MCMHAADLRASGARFVQKGRRSPASLVIPARSCRIHWFSCAMSGGPELPRSHWIEEGNHAAPDAQYHVEGKGFSVRSHDRTVGRRPVRLGGSTYSACSGSTSCSAKRPFKGESDENDDAGQRDERAGDPTIRFAAQPVDHVLAAAAGE